MQCGWHYGTVEWKQWITFTCHVSYTDSQAPLLVQLCVCGMPYYFSFVVNGKTSLYPICVYSKCSK